MEMDKVTIILKDKIGIKILNFNTNDTNNFVLKANKLTTIFKYEFDLLKENNLFKGLLESGKIKIIETKKRGRRKKEDTNIEDAEDAKD